MPVKPKVGVQLLVGTPLLAKSELTKVCGWRNTTHSLTSNYLLFPEPLKPTTTWTFTPKPPVITRTSTVMPQAPPEWGRPSNLEEVFETRELPEFQSSYFKSAALSTSVRQQDARRRALMGNDAGAVSDLGIGAASRKRCRDIFGSDSENSNSRDKNTRTPKVPTPPILLVASTFPHTEANLLSNTPFVSAHLFIDLVCAIMIESSSATHCLGPVQPHCNPCPAPPISPPPVAAEILTVITEYPIFRKIESHPTYSYRLPALEWNAPYARGAWIIPLNGPALVSEGSPASVIDECGHVPPSDMSGSSEATAEPPWLIHWTPSAVKGAWHTLKTVRKNNAMGSIGLYFECDEGDRKDLPHPRRSSTPCVTGNSTSSHARSSPTNDSIRRNEWIKVCCDGRHALRIRTVLAQFRANDDHSTRALRVAGGTGLAQDATARRKVLEGAKLVYVDELGSPILIA
jgi:hypothetical protein